MQLLSFLHQRTPCTSELREGQHYPPPHPHLCLNIPFSCPKIISFPYPTQDIPVPFPYSKLRNSLKILLILCFFPSPYSSFLHTHYPTRNNVCQSLFLLFYGNSYLSEFKNHHVQNILCQKFRTTFSPSKSATSANSITNPTTNDIRSRTFSVYDFRRFSRFLTMGTLKYCGRKDNDKSGLCAENKNEKCVNQRGSVPQKSHESLFLK